MGANDDGSKEPDTSTSGDASTPEDASSVVVDGGHDPSTPDDTTAPTVVLSVSPKTVTSPGTIALSVTASDANGIAKVVAYSGNKVLSTFDAPPYDVAVTVAGPEDNGTYAFRAEATDPAGNVGKSVSVSIKVDIPDVTSAAPSFVAASAPTLITAATSLVLPTPAGVQADDLVIAFVDAAEGSGPHTVTTPAGWTRLGGFPLHNLASAHSPYVIPSTENHGTWIFYKIASANESASTSFAFQAAATARGVVLGYRGVDPTNPIHDKSAYDFYGTGDTNGLGMGNTTLKSGRQVNLIATAFTSSPTYTTVLSDPSRIERVNSGEQPNGLNVVVYDSSFSMGIFTGASIANKQSPSGSAKGFLFSATTLVLTPK